MTVRAFDALDRTPVAIRRVASPTERERQPLFFFVGSVSDLTVPATRFDLSGVDEVQLGRGERAVAREGRTLVLRIPDNFVSNRHAHLCREGRQWRIVDDGSRNGTFVDGLLTTQTLLDENAVIQVGDAFFVFAHGDARHATGEPAALGVMTLLPELERQLHDLACVALSSTSVLLLGETGTGKEVLANAVHRQSGRGGPFVAVNCGALSSTLLESELFGHRKGAFSGATENRSGWIRSAHGGTLLLDEIGDLPLPAQAALLRVLQEREVVPVGEQRPIPVDVRICAATHRDLEALVNAGQFRRDLFVRLQGYTFRVPPLRERRVDFGLLASTLLRRLTGNALATVRLAPDAALALLRYDWPGNIRELEKCLESGLALAGSGEIELRHLPDDVRQSLLPVPTLNAPRVDGDLRDQLTALLRVHRGNVAAVARALGKHPFQIHRWIKRYAIEIAAFRQS